MSKLMVVVGYRECWTWVFMWRHMALAEHEQMDVPVDETYILGAGGWGALCACRNTKTGGGTQYPCHKHGLQPKEEQRQWQR